MEFSLNAKNNSVLTYRGYEYNKHRQNKKDGTILWRCKECRHYRCKSYIKTNQDMNEIVLPPSSHCHDSCPQKAQANIIMSNLKFSVKHAGGDPKNMIKNEMVNLNEDILVHLPKKASIDRLLSRYRANERLPNPTTPNFRISDEFIHLVLYDSGENDPDRILAIGDVEMLQILETDTIYGVGTFEEVLIFQIFTWHAQIDNLCPPCIYFFLQRKDLETYNKMFQIFKILLPNLAPSKILVDFEESCMNAVQLIFPNAEIKGTYFHLYQTLKQEINNVGLKTEFEAVIDIKLMLKSLAVLTFVPCEDVKQVFNTLISIFPDRKEFTKIASYFLLTFIGSENGEDPQFPIKTWNHYETVIVNSSEAIPSLMEYHNTINSYFQHKNPSVWLLFGNIGKDIMCHKNKLKIFKLESPKLKKRKEEILIEKLTELVSTYQWENDKVLYLRRIANLQ